MFVAAGTRLNWIGNFSADAFSNQSAVDAVQAVAAGLKNKYNLIIERSNPSISAGASQASTISLDLLTNMDRGNGSDGMVDIQGNVDDEFALVGNANDDSNITITSSVAVSTTTVNTSSCDTLVDKFRNALPTWLGGTPVTPSQEACRTQAGNMAIRNVAVNAGTAYGAGSATGQAASTSASAQQAANIKTQAQLAEAARKAAAGDNIMLYIGIGVAAVVVVVVGIMAVK
jgi:hypothetical protein